MDHIIALRFSAMGDVLMTVPVIDSFARQHPDVRITVASRPWAKPIFDLLPKNVYFVDVDLKKKYAGYSGLNKLGRRLLALQPTHIADLHDVLRTKWLRLRFSVAGLKVAHIKKDRHARKEFLNAKEKQLQKSGFEKYADVFCRLGFKEFTIDFKSLFPAEGAELSTSLPSFDVSKRPERHWIGIAPFAAHRGKIYPLPLMEKVVSQLSADNDIRIFLFGAGAQERTTLEGWAAKYPHVESMVGQLNDIGEELALISRCCVMITMDSGNMHLASLAAVPVVSIWGATHPYGGFLGYGQSIENVIQDTTLPCRPCSMYGNKECQYGDYRCLTAINPDRIVKKTKGLLFP